MSVQGHPGSAQALRPEIASSLSVTSRLGSPSGLAPGPPVVSKRLKVLRPSPHLTLDVCRGCLCWQLLSEALHGPEHALEGTPSPPPVHLPRAGHLESRMRCPVPAASSAGLGGLQGCLREAPSLQLHSFQRSLAEPTTLAGKAGPITKDRGERPGEYSTASWARPGKPRTQNTQAKEAVETGKASNFSQLFFFSTALGI